ncbi:MAG: transcriptional regulator, partial [Alphaproteobacteria bacterium]|nr:transcriptional regulator [Alphaproteobacteria bacterium]
ADSARYAGDPDFERLIATLMRASPEFRAWWPKHEVLRLISSRKRIRHPVGGKMAFEYTSFAVADQPDMKLVVYTPLEEDGTVAKLEALLRGSRTQA